MYVHCVSLIGRRPTNEDHHDFVLNRVQKMKKYKNCDYFAIFDGHGGKFVSKYINDMFHKYLIEENKMNSKIKYSNHKELKTFVLNISDFIQNELIKIPKNSRQTGSTALIIIKTNKSINVFNTGDCRAVLCNKNNVGIPLTKDHKPMAYDEYRRITNLGGKIVKDGQDYRIKDLSVSRAYGDLAATPYVTHIPEIFNYDLCKTDKFIVMGCDGLWDVLSNQDVCDFVLSELGKRKFISQQNNTHSDKNIAYLLAQYAIKKGSYDNVSVILIIL